MRIRTHKTCRRCDQTFSIDGFYLHGKYLDSWCKECRKEYRKEYETKNKEKIAVNKHNYWIRVGSSKQKSILHIKNERRRLRTKEYKDLFLSMYGGKCACCGESEKEFLTIEHKNGQVGKTRKEKGYETGERGYKKASQEYLPDVYEILCWNCNCTKGMLGYCPHQRK